MSLTPYSPAYYAGNQAWLNPNPNFASYPASPGYPTSWGPWAGAIPTIGASAQPAVEITGAAGANAGIAAPVNGFSGPGWYVIRAVVTLLSGALTGASATLGAGPSYGALAEFPSLSLSGDPDINGIIQGAGAVGTTYTFQKLVQVLLPASTVGEIYAMAHNSGVGSVSSANAVAFSLCAVRPAFPAEIAAGNQVQGLPVFPLLPGVTPDPEKAPSWSTKVLRASAGNERRTALWPYPIWNFTLKHEVIRDRPSLDEIHGVWELFNTVQGQFGAFLFLDQTDFLVTGQALGPGDGVTTQWQLMRSIRDWTEPVLAPFGVTVLVGGAPVSFSLGAYGVVTLGSPPASGAPVTWSGGFFYPCRFTQDDLTLKRIASQLWSNDGLKFSSVRSIT
jgi:uncharacterized protein (TIGR02217 family)